jgi:hypothetical protein
MLKPYTSGSIGAAKNDNSWLAGLEIYLALPKGGEAATVSCMMICIRIRVMRLMSDSVYAYAYGRLYIYEIDQSINKSF